jgi:chemotaxis protein histidine kinase CheA
MSEIKINCIGPVEEFAYELKDPGIHVLKGDAGVGKTTILKTVEFSDGATNDKPIKKDGAKSGVAVIGGKTIKVMKTVREEGELGFECMGDLDLYGLHSPRFQNATTRDAHRIKALVRMAKVTPDASLFHDLLQSREEFDAIVDSDAVATDDLVEMAAKVKRAIDKAALSEERQAETARANQRSKSELFAGVNFDAPHDQQALRDAQVKAIENKSAVSQKRQDAMRTIATAKDARGKLDAADNGAVSVADATKALEAAFEARSAADAAVHELERQLADAKHQLSLAESQAESAGKALLSAKRHEELTSEWRSQIEAAEGIDCPTEEDVARAVAAVDAANEACDIGKVVRDAIQAKSDAARFSEVAKGHEKTAKRLRDAATATQDVLSEAIARIPNCPLRVWNDEDGNARIVLKTDRSEAEPFDELSDGERYDVLMPMLFNPGRIVVLSQAGYGELSPAIRSRVHNCAKERGAFLLTAQADAGPLRAEPYQTNGGSKNAS